MSASSQELPNLPGQLKDLLWVLRRLENPEGLLAGLKDRPALKKTVLDTFYVYLVVGLVTY